MKLQIHKKDKNIPERNTIEAIIMKVSLIIKINHIIANITTTVKTIATRSEAIIMRVETMMIRDNIVKIIKKEKIHTIESLNMKTKRKEQIM